MLHHDDNLIKAFLTPKFDFDYEGKWNFQAKDNDCMIMHGRTATNGNFIENTHPFYSVNGDAFVHNGIIHNTNDWDFTLDSDNDSEILANMFWKFGIDFVGENTDGYYAFMNIDKDGVMHIVKDNRANLHMAYIKEIESYIVATTDCMIELLCKMMDWEQSTICVINDCCYIQIKGNEVLSWKTFEKAKSTTVMSYRQSQAFKDYELKHNKANGYSNDYNTWGEYDPNNTPDDEYFEFEVNMEDEELAKHVADLKKLV
jgi:hypothetical protein